MARAASIRAITKNGDVNKLTKAGVSHKHEQSATTGRTREEKITQDDSDDEAAERRDREGMRETG